MSEGSEGKTEIISVDEYLTSQTCNNCKKQSLNHISTTGSKRKLYDVLKCDSSFIGVSAVSQFITYVAYRRRELDIKLMYSQNILDMIYNYNKFRKTNLQKMIIIIFAVFALSLGFIPTLFTKLNRSTYIYSERNFVTLQKEGATWSTANMPVLDDFLQFTQVVEKPFPTTKKIMETYLKNNLNQNITRNPTGLWFLVDPKKSFEFTSNQYGSIDGFFTNVNASLSGSGSTLKTFTAFSSRASDTMPPTSSSLRGCSNDPTNLITNISAKAGFVIEAVHTYDYACYPMYDRSSAVYVINKIPNKLSMLSVNDNIYRSSQLNPGVTALGSFGVSLFNHNNTHMSMGIKKMASMTFFNYKAKMTSPHDCRLNNKFENATADFKNLPHNYMLCYLLDMMPPWNVPTPSIRVVQETRKYYEQNRAMNVVYTVQNGNTYEEGQSVMIDLNMFTVFNLKGQLADDKEHLIAYETKSYGATMNIFASIASMRARWTNNDFSDFTRVTTDVTSAVDTTPAWIVAVVLLCLLFLLPQFTRLLVRRDPLYARDFRTILITTLENESTSTNSLNKKIEAKRIDMIANPSIAGKSTISLCIDGCLVKKVKNEDENSLILNNDKSSD
ncbi:hypothetical protein BDF21DRAFT_468073 [Thamnidium elegans]|nr:hypothetical protein BDF21DRAFT_468073 [Thamnidium elegans]